MPTMRRQVSDGQFFLVAENAPQNDSPMKKEQK